MEKISENLKEMGKKTCEDCIGCNYCSDYDKYDINFIYSLPKAQDVRTECSRFIDKADVVPRSEVERLQGDIKLLREINDSLSVFQEKAKQELAREIFAEIDKVLNTQEKYLYCNPSLTYVYELIAELKKKYTEEWK